MTSQAEAEVVAAVATAGRMATMDGKAKADDEAAAEIKMVVAVQRTRGVINKISASLDHQAAIYLSSTCPTTGQMMTCMSTSLRMGMSSAPK
jgi:hypothetical protein